MGISFCVFPRSSQLLLKARVLFSPRIFFIDRYFLLRFLAFLAIASPNAHVLFSEKQVRVLVRVLAIASPIAHSVFHPNCFSDQWFSGAWERAEKVERKSSKTRTALSRQIRHGGRKTIVNMMMNVLGQAFAQEHSSSYLKWFFDRFAGFAGQRRFESSGLFFPLPLPASMLQKAIVVVVVVAAAVVVVAVISLNGRSSCNT